MNNKMFVCIMIFGLINIFDTAFGANKSQDEDYTGALLKDYFLSDGNMFRDYKVLEVGSISKPGTMPVTCQFSPTNAYNMEIVPNYSMKYEVIFGIHLDEKMLEDIQKKLGDNQDDYFYVTLQKKDYGQNKKTFSPATFAIKRDNFEAIKTEYDEIWVAKNKYFYQAQLPKFPSKNTNYSITVSDEDLYSHITYFNYVLIIRDETYEILEMYNDGNTRLVRAWQNVSISEDLLKDMAQKTDVFYLYAYEKPRGKEEELAYCAKVIKMIVNGETIQLNDPDKNLKSLKILKLFGYGILFFTALYQLGWLDKVQQLLMNFF